MIIACLVMMLFSLIALAGLMRNEWSEKYPTHFKGV